VLKESETPAILRNKGGGVGNELGKMAETGHQEKSLEEALPTP
jgi:hypothetical protein